MIFKEKCKKVDVYSKVEKEIESTNTELETAKSELEATKFELETAKSELETTKSELEEINKKISIKKSELKSLKTEIIELKNFIDQKFESGDLKSDHAIRITNCYIIGLNGKKYITIRRFERCFLPGDYKGLPYSIKGIPTVEHYDYYDALNICKNKKSGKSEFKWLYRCMQSYYSNNKELITVSNDLNYEKHILEVYPELANFVNDMVPNAYLKKIYYEINDLSSKKLTKN